MPELLEKEVEPGKEKVDNVEDDFFSAFCTETSGEDFLDSEPCIKSNGRLEIEANKVYLGADVKMRQ